MIKISHLFFFLLSFSSFACSSEHIQERIRNEQMKDRSLTHSYYEVPWSFGSADRLNEFIDELNQKLSKYELIANAQTHYAEQKLIITLKALFEGSDSRSLPVHTIEMPLNDEEHSKNATDFVLQTRIDHIAARGEKLRKFLAKISVREVKQNWKHIFKLEILPATIRNVSHTIGNEIGSALKNILLEQYQLFRLRKLLPHDNSIFAAQVQNLETRKTHIDGYQSELEEINDSLSHASDEQEIIQLKKQKAALQKKYIQDKLKQTEE